MSGPSFINFCELSLCSMPESFQINIPSPVECLQDFHQDYEVYIKREELIHPLFGGNKWRKLKYNIEFFNNNDYSHIISFGGAFSNHIAALSAIAYKYNIPSVGLIRGEINDLNNPTLTKAKANGMELYAISRSEYRLKENSKDVQEILSQYPNSLLIPEGGSNELARKGVNEIGYEIGDRYDYVIVAAGTGMTAMGILESLSPETKLIIVAVLKDNSLVDKMKSVGKNASTYHLTFDFHEGGYAKVTERLSREYHSFFNHYNIALDPIYNAKVLLALRTLCYQNYFQRGSKILFLNTGGLQGSEAYIYRFGNKWAI